jgi:hypothetical protein
MSQLDKLALLDAMTGPEQWLGAQMNAPQDGGTCLLLEQYYWEWRVKTDKVFLEA